MIAGRLDDAKPSVSAVASHTFEAASVLVLCIGHHAANVHGSPLYKRHWWFNAISH